MKTHPLSPSGVSGLLAFALIASSSALAVSSPTAPVGTPPGTGSKVSAVQTVNNEVNVATKAMGATAHGAGGNLEAVLNNVPNARAVLVPAGNSAVAVGTIDLGGMAKLSRVAVNIEPAKGRLVLIGIDSKGGTVDVSSLLTSGNILSDIALDGTQSSISVDVAKIPVQSVAIYWVAASGNAPLVIYKVGLLTRDQHVNLHHNGLDPGHEGGPRAVPAAQLLTSV